MNLNKVMLIGNVTADPEQKATPSGQAVTTFSIATNLVWTDQSGQKQKKVEFHNIVAWRRLAEICGQYLKKGSKIYLEGRLQTRDWTGQDGVKRYRTEIVAENMIMLDSRGGASDQGFGQNSGGRSQTPDFSEPVINEGTPTNQGNKEYSEEDIQIENIPF